MTRVLYRCLLRLHPPAFRREFAGEMMWIFEEASAEGVAPLFVDGVVSLLRQWLVRMGPWKVALALLGGLFEITAGGLGGALFTDAQLRSHIPSTPSHPIPMEGMMHVAMWAVTGVLLMVAFLALWVKSLNDKRLSSLR